MKRIIDFFKNYRLFGATLVVLIVSLLLQLAWQSTIAHWLLAIMSIIAVLPLLWDMVEDVRAGSYGIDILAITAIVTAVILKEHWAAIVVVLMLTGGESLENYAERKAQSELDELLKHAPHKARVLRKGKEQLIAVNEVKVGDKLLVHAGDVVPVDAIVIEGIASFDESSLTGESLPQPKSADQQLLSGAISLDGSIIAKATSTAEDSQYQQIIKLVRNASHSKAPYVRLAERYSLPFTFTAYAIASAVWIISGDAIRFLEVIIVATPCPLLLAAPIALISGMARASRFGIIVKTGSALERLAEAETFAFDKTGTLTKGSLKVAGVLAFRHYTKNEVLELAAGLEQSSNHIVARAIIDAAHDQGLRPRKAKQIKEVPGLGLEANIKGSQVIVGRLRLLKDRGVVLQSAFQEKSFNQTVVFVAIDGKLAGAISLEDEIRAESQATIDALQVGGIKNFLMVTGDNKATAQAVAAQLGISTVHADALPADKLHLLAKTPGRPLVFVGDGVNDAPVLTSADVGIALGARGSTAASESADVVIMLDDLSRVATAHTIARKTFRIAGQSVFIGILLSLVLMLVFATGKFPPLAGAIVQEVVDIIVIVNALRARLIRVE